MKVTSCVAAAEVFAGLSAFTVGTAVAGASPFVSASSPVLSSPAGIGWSFEWDDDDDDWSQTRLLGVPGGLQHHLER